MGKLTEAERQAIHIKRYIEVLCEIGMSPDYLDLYQDDVEIFIRLLWHDDCDPSKILIEFPRSAKMKPYYPAICKWFEREGIESKDKLRGEKKYRYGDKFMSGEVDKDPAHIENLVNSARDAVFNGKPLKLNPSGFRSKHKLTIITPHPEILMALAGSVLFCVVIFPLYELTRISHVTIPSYKNVDLFEIFLVIWPHMVPPITNYLVRKPRLPRKNTWSRKKTWILRLIIWPIVLLIMASTA